MEIYILRDLFISFESFLNGKNSCTFVSVGGKNCVITYCFSLLLLKNAWKKIFSIWIISLTFSIFSCIFVPDFNWNQIKLFSWGFSLECVPWTVQGTINFVLLQASSAEENTALILLRFVYFFDFSFLLLHVIETMWSSWRLWFYMSRFASTVFLNFKLYFKFEAVASMNCSSCWVKSSASRVHLSLFQSSSTLLALSNF